MTLRHRHTSLCATLVEQFHGDSDLVELRKVTLGELDLEGKILGTGIIHQHYVIEIAADSRWCLRNLIGKAHIADICSSCQNNCFF